LRGDKKHKEEKEREKYSKASYFCRYHGLYRRSDPEASAEWTHQRVAT